MKTFTPPSENIIFYDGEFTSLDPYTGELLSVAMVKPSGEEFYTEIEYGGEVSDWDKKYVLPHLRGNFVSRKEARDSIAQFLGKKQPHLVCFVPQYDMIFLHKLFEVESKDQNILPYHWMPIDFASILFSLGINPQYYSDMNPDFFSNLNIDYMKYKKHNALDDAKLLKETYNALILK